MDILQSIQFIYPKIGEFLLVTSRLFALFYTFNLYRNSMATYRILLSLSVILSFFVVTTSKSNITIDDIMSLKFALSGVVQLLIGFCAGMILNITFEVFSALGQIVSTQVGLSTASLFDPRFGMITSLGQFYLITATIIFLSINGHLLTIEFMFKSFHVLPVGELVSGLDLMGIISYASIIFSGSVLISLTLIISILMTNMCLAVMSKFAPQFNLFSVGMNMTVVIGLICAYLCYQIIIERGDEVLTSSIGTYHSFVLELAPHE